MAERGEGEEAPEVALHQRKASAIENADDGESDEQRSDGSGLGRE